MTITFNILVTPMAIYTTDGIWPYPQGPFFCDSYLAREKQISSIELPNASSVFLVTLFLSMFFIFVLYYVLFSFNDMTGPLTFPN